MPSDTRGDAPANPLPVPSQAQGPTIPEDKGYFLKDLSDGLYFLTNGIYQVMFAVTDSGVVLFDAPPSMGPLILPAIAEVTDNNITHLVYSHSHIDHIGYASEIVAASDSPLIITSKSTSAKLARFADPARPAPTLTFEGNYTLEVDGFRAELSAVTPGHEDGDVYIYVPSSRTLMVVDIVFPGWVPFKNLALAHDPGFFVSAHDAILAFDFEYFIGGHLTRIGTKTDVRIAKEFVVDLVDAAAIALANVSFAEVAGRVNTPGNPWVIFSNYQDEVSRVCYERMLSLWKDRLGGVDVYTLTHCWVMQEFLAVDGMPMV